jgi:predicted Zn-dependent protease
MLRKFLVISALIAAVVGLEACAKKPSPQEACSFVQNGDQQRISWGADIPVVLYIDGSVPPEFNDSIAGAIDDWNRSVGREILKLGGRVSTNGEPQQDGVNVIYYMKTWENNRMNEQARTTVYWAGDHIYEADIRINASAGGKHEFFVGEDPQTGKIDMQSLMLHEFGHVLGLAHAVNPQSVMVRSLPTATLRRQLSANDLSSIRCEY